MSPSIYIIGPERDLSDNNKSKYHDVHTLLHSFNVAMHTPCGSQRIAGMEPGEDNLGNYEIRKEFARDLDALLSCDAVALLPDWSSSRGATAEYTVAKAAGLPVFSIDVL